MTLLNFLGLANPLSGIFPAIWMLLAFVTIIIVNANVFHCNWVGFDLKGDDKTFWKSFFILYPIWGWVQQGIMFIILYYTRMFLPIWIANLLVAFLFAWIHFPNYHLQFPVFGILLAFILFMDQYHNLYAISLIHGAVATCWAGLVPKAISTKFSLYGEYIHDQNGIQELIHIPDSLDDLLLHQTKSACLEYQETKSEAQFQIEMQNIIMGYLKQR